MPMHASRPIEHDVPVSKHGELADRTRHTTCLHERGRGTHRQSPREANHSSIMHAPCQGASSATTFRRPDVFFGRHAAVGGPGRTPCLPHRVVVPFPSHAEDHAARYDVPRTTRVPPAPTTRPRAARARVGCQGRAGAGEQRARARGGAGGARGSRSSGGHVGHTGPNDSVHCN